MKNKTLLDQNPQKHTDRPLYIHFCTIQAFAKHNFSAILIKQ